MSEPWRYPDTSRDWKPLEQIALDYDPTIEQLRAKLQHLRELKTKRPLTSIEIVEYNSHTSQLTHLNEIRRKCANYYKRGGKSVETGVQQKPDTPNTDTESGSHKDSLEIIDTETEKLLAELLR